MDDVDNAERKVQGIREEIERAVQKADDAESELEKEYLERRVEELEQDLVQAQKEKQAAISRSRVNALLALVLVLLFASVAYALNLLPPLPEHIAQVLIPATNVNQE